MIAPRDHEIVSPELVLVDPVLAAAARERLPEPSLVVAEPRPGAPVQQKVNREAIYALADAALAMPDEHYGSEGQHRWRLLAGVAAVTVVSLLLLDVRVEVGRTPASAEPNAMEGAADSSPPSGTGPSKSGGPSEQMQPRRFAWAPAAGASGYHVEFFREAVRVLSLDTKGPELTTPARWLSGGSARSFVRGEYRWYVWPVTSGHRASKAIVQATFVVS